MSWEGLPSKHINMIHENSWVFHQILKCIQPSVRLEAISEITFSGDKTLYYRQSVMQNWYFLFLLLHI